MHLKRYFFSFLLVAVLVLPTRSIAETLSDAENAIEAGRHAEALPILRRLADSGDRDAQTYLGGLFVAGLGTPRDFTSAAVLFTKAAEQGQPFAQYNLGLMHARGDGLPKDEVKAVEWYRRAAEQRLVAAMTQYGLALLGGRGAEKNPKKAVHWLERSANAGDLEAQNQLGILLAVGDQVPADRVQAYVWFLLAERGGLKDARGNPERLKSQLSSGEQAKAEEAVEAWRPSIDSTSN